MPPELQELVAVIQNQNKTHLIFDLDQTITEFDMPWHIWQEQVAAEMPPKRAKELIAILAEPGGPWGDVVNAQIREDAAFYDKLIAISEAFELKHFAHTPYHAMVQVLHQLHADGIRMYVWTSNTRAAAERALIEMGIRDCFDVLITRESTRFSKPDTEGWKYLKHLDAPKDHFLFIGDSQNDNLAAQGIGIDFYKISYFSP